MLSDSCLQEHDVRRAIVNAVDGKIESGQAYINEALCTALLHLMHFADKETGLDDDDEEDTADSSDFVVSEV